jgi:hypothetical protein
MKRYVIVTMALVVTSVILFPTTGASEKKNERARCDKDMVGWGWGDSL